MTQSVQTNPAERPATAPQPISPSSNTIARVPSSVAERLFQWETTKRSLLDGTSPEVLQCAREHGGHHKWIRIEVVFEGREFATDLSRSELLTICGRCCVRRCYAGVNGPDSECIHPIHHREPHRDERGRWREVGK